MKLILSLATLFFAAPIVQAQVVVTNPISDILSQTMHVADIAKGRKTGVLACHGRRASSLSLRGPAGRRPAAPNSRDGCFPSQQLQRLQAYVKAFGDPEKLTQITGADQLISSLKQSGVGKTIGELRQLSNGVEALPACQPISPTQRLRKPSDPQSRCSE
jgi:hypothetical protein